MYKEHLDVGAKSLCLIIRQRGASKGFKVGGDIFHSTNIYGVSVRQALWSIDAEMNQTSLFPAFIALIG